METESERTRRFCAEMIRLNGVVFAVVGGVRQEAGWPDRYICHRVWQGWIEFKNPNGTLSTKQRIVLRSLHERKPGLAYVVRWPGYVELWDGTVVAEFDGSARDFLEAMKLLLPG